MTDAERSRNFDKVMAEVFISNNAAFLGPLLASLNFQWTKAIDTSATDGVNLYWNPDDFDRLTFEERCGSLMHELAHVWKLHNLRRGDRDEGTWNTACDININRDLRHSGFYADGPWFVGPHPEIKATLEEEIYEWLMKQGAQQKPIKGTCSCSQLPPTTKAQAQTAVQSVVRAVQAAKMADKPGSIPGEVEGLLNTFLKPQISWKQHINQWFNDKLGVKYSLKRPNRRYLPHGIVMKSRVLDDERLAHLLYFFDVSGSVDDDQVTSFNSEMKFLKETYQPKKMSLILFDTRIQKAYVMTDDDDFNELKVHGRGGTSLECVHQYIQDCEDASAALIFSDLECAPMRPVKLPVIWVCVDNPSATVPFGKLLHIKSSEL